MPHRFNLRVGPHARTMIRFLRMRSFRYNTLATFSRLLPATGFTNPSSTHSLMSMGTNARPPLTSRSSLNFLKHAASFVVFVQTLLGVLRSRQLTVEGLCISWQSPSQSLPIPAGTLSGPSSCIASFDGLVVISTLLPLLLFGKKGFTLSHASVPQISSITIRYRRPNKLLYSISPNSCSLSSPPSGHHIIIVFLLHASRSRAVSLPRALDRDQQQPATNFRCSPVRTASSDEPFFLARSPSPSSVTRRNVAASHPPPFAGHSQTSTGESSSPRAVDTPPGEACPRTEAAGDPLSSTAGR
ncbi:protein TONSOKU [Striga asiatica]|uniref:Protein TONSOKU n=1 Tax=Striga asiatica TaxID=4170 RepID=A0A5A7Q5A9_STRAF|nr:protein TONSOKU [Striga asiatica]